MKDRKIDYDGNAPHSTYPKSWAYPPLYLLRSADHCPECGQATFVYMLGCAAFHDAEDGEPIEDFHFLRGSAACPGVCSACSNANAPALPSTARRKARRPT